MLPKLRRKRRLQPHGPRALANDEFHTRIHHALETLGFMILASFDRGHFTAEQRGFRAEWW